MYSKNTNRNANRQITTCAVCFFNQPKLCSFRVPDKRCARLILKIILKSQHFMQFYTIKKSRAF